MQTLLPVSADFIFFGYMGGDNHLKKKKKLLGLFMVESKQEKATSWAAGGDLSYIINEVK